MPKDWSVLLHLFIVYSLTHLSEVTPMPLSVDRGVTKFTQHWMSHACTPSLFNASVQCPLQLVIHLSACGGANNHCGGAKRDRGAHMCD